MSDSIDLFLQYPIIYSKISSSYSSGGVPQYNPVEKDGNRYGCGHNLLGKGSLAAAIALRYYGCFGEEIGG
ncbi:hypothetical protein WAX78_15740 [Bacillus sp. FJAT-53711]|uniref:Uncharacterized protein n=1 Tax=Bacillus yunxiaonensis TaxID=3127665 RepID=A0ABU8FVB1_9BACI